MSAEQIRLINDIFRNTFNVRYGKVMMTASVAALPDADRHAVMEKVRTFSDFSEDNDPYSEHDFVSVEHNGEKFFGKIDYYDKQMKYGSENPADFRVTCRVLTIMKSEDY